MEETMNAPGFEDAVRARAYALWESEGRPAGRDAEHWRLCEEEIRREMAPSAPAESPARPKAKAVLRRKATGKNTAAGGAGVAAFA